jgi:ATP-binding cassette subfamily F protein 3
MIRLDKVAIAQGGNTLLRDATWHLRPGAKVGIVGRNGSGKTTLLRALAGELTVEHGSLQRRGRARIGYLPQAAVAGSTETVWDEAANAMTHLQKLADELAAAERALEADRPGALERVDAATEAWRLAGGPTKDQTVGSVLHGLGFTPGAWAQACDTLSGGWQMRVALARVLLAQPDVALLDEPTNHLDITARSWLAKHLAAAKYAVVVVSHDRHLLDKAVTEVVALSHQTLETFKGNYSRYLAEKAARQLTAQRSFDKQQSEIKHMEHFIERFGAKATKAAAARSRKKALDRMDRVHAPQTEASGPRLRLPEAPPSAQEVITLTDVSAGWDDGPDVLRGVDLCLTRGMRLAVLGANGTEKGADAWETGCGWACSAKTWRAPSMGSAPPLSWWDKRLRWPLHSRSAASWARWASRETPPCVPRRACPEASGPGPRWRCSWPSRAMRCCWTSPPTTWTWTPWTFSQPPWPPSRARCCW